MAMRPKPGRQGFTLIEVLVTLVLISLAAGALVPTVINQISRGETARIVKDLTAIEVGAKAFRVDVQRWPRWTTHLVRPITAADSALTGGVYPGGLLPLWRGPYLERGAIPGDTIPTAGGGVILRTMTSETWGGSNFLTVKVKGVTHDQARRVSLVLDGDTAVAASGRVRWKSGGSSPDTLIFFAAPTH